MARNAEVTDETRVYVEVFGIALDACPPDYFTLLGLDRDSAEPAEIESAAKQRALLLNKSLPSELHLPARKVLKRMERAKI